MEITLSTTKQTVNLGFKPSKIFIYNFRDNECFLTGYDIVQNNTYGWAFGYKDGFLTSQYSLNDINNFINNITNTGFDFTLNGNFSKLIGMTCKLIVIK